MGVVWVHWLMALGQILKESLVPLATPYRHEDTRLTGRGRPRRHTGTEY